MADQEIINLLPDKIYRKGMYAELFVNSGEIIYRNIEPRPLSSKYYQGTDYSLLPAHIIHLKYNDKCIENILDLLNIPGYIKKEGECIYVN